MSLIIPDRMKGRPPADDGERSTRRTAWSFLAAAAVLVLLVGMLRVAFSIVPPPDPGNAELLFASATALLDIVWLPALGAALALAACINLRRLRLARWIVLVLLGLAGLAAAGGLAALRAGPALVEQGADPETGADMFRAVILAAVQAPGFVWLALLGWRGAHGRT